MNITLPKVSAAMERLLAPREYPTTLTIEHMRDGVRRHGMRVDGPFSDGDALYVTLSAHSGVRVKCGYTVWLDALANGHVDALVGHVANRVAA